MFLAGVSVKQPQGPVPRVGTDRGAISIAPDAKSRARLTLITETNFLYPNLQQF
jgi:hypothetical protein